MPTPRIQRIVVGVDFSQPSISALAWVAQNFQDAELMLVHCLELPHLPAFLARHAAARDRTRELASEGARERLAILGHSLGSAHVQTEVRECTPVEGIIASTSAFNADLVVVASTGAKLGASLRGRLGRTAERLARISSVPVLLHTGARREHLRRLLVAVDDSEITPHVLAWTRYLAARFDARVTAVHVVSSAVMTHVLTMAAAGGASDAEVSREAREEFRDDADGWINEMVTSGLDPERVTSEVEFGEPGQEIIAASLRLDSDMIVLGSKGAGVVRRALLGSVVSEVLHWARCPVLVVVDPTDEIEEAIEDAIEAK